MEALPTTRVLIADVDPLVRHALRVELSATEDLEVVAETSPDTEVVDIAAESQATIVLFEPHVRGQVRLDLVAALVGLEHEPSVLAFSAYRDLRTEIGTLRAGARGFLRKADGVGGIPAALRAVSRGEVAISRQLTLDIIEHLRSAPMGDVGMRPVRSPLTAREWEVLDLMSGGLSTRAIAEALFVSPDTVYSHIKNVMRKLDVHSRADAVAAARAGAAEPSVNGGGPPQARFDLRG